MKIRGLTIDDYDAMIRLWLAAGLPFKPKGRDNRDSIADQMRAEPSFFIGAFEANDLVGVAILSSDQRKGWINRLAVHPSHRRKGFAKALVSECEKVLRAHGLRLTCALIEDSNTVSRKLFRSCGYLEHDDIKYFSKRESEDI